MMIPLPIMPPRNPIHRQAHQRAVTWFDLSQNIQLHYDAISHDEFPDADYVIATAASTASAVASLSSQKGRKFYLIQGYEASFTGNTVRSVERSYNLGFTNIAISKELSGIIGKATGKIPEYLPNFYNHHEFFLENAIAGRKNVVCLLNHSSETKRTKLGLDVLKKVKERIPDLQVELFGAYQPVAKLDSYIHFTYCATPEQLRKSIYGKSKVYLLPSVLEGWVLTGMEAMACGAVFVASRIGGVADYTNDGNSILVTPDDEDGFVEAIVHLLADEKLRQTIAQKALDEVQQYDINVSVKKLETILADGKE